MEVIANKISKKSLFKLLFIGLSFGFFVFFLMCGIADIFFGTETVRLTARLGETPITGFSGSLLALAMWPIFSFFFAGFIWILSILGLWIYSFMRPLKVVFKGVESPSEKVV